MIFTHLFSAPLIEHKRAEGGSGCVLSVKVDELSYQGERETLLKTLANAGKMVRFLSEAANTKSFIRAVGCSSPSASASLGAGARGGRAALLGGRRSCRDGECRIMHFTGHGVPGQLTFEDEHGQLQYVDQDGLLDMLLQDRRRGQAAAAAAAVLGSSSTSNAVGADCAPSRRSALASRRSPPLLTTPLDPPPDYNAGGDGYGPFIDEEVPFEGLEVGEGEEGFGEEGRASPSRSGLQLVFLSSCHSASVANCFIQAVRFLAFEFCG